MVGKCFACTHRKAASLYDVLRGRYSMEKGSRRLINDMGKSMKTLTDALSRVGRVRLWVCDPRDRPNRRLEIICDMVQCHSHCLSCIRDPFSSVLLLRVLLCIWSSNITRSFFSLNGWCYTVVIEAKARSWEVYGCKHWTKLNDATTCVIGSPEVSVFSSDKWGCRIKRFMPWRAASRETDANVETCEVKQQSFQG